MSRIHIGQAFNDVNALLDHVPDPAPPRCLSAHARCFAGSDLPTHDASKRNADLPAPLNWRLGVSRTPQNWIWPTFRPKERTPTWLPTRGCGCVARGAAPRTSCDAGVLRRSDTARASRVEGGGPLAGLELSLPARWRPVIAAFATTAVGDPDAQPSGVIHA
jgi:hypothetical protein